MTSPRHGLPPVRRGKCCQLRSPEMLQHVFSRHLVSLRLERRLFRLRCLRHLHLSFFVFLRHHADDAGAVGYGVVVVCEEQQALWSLYDFDAAERKRSERLKRFHKVVRHICLRLRFRHPPCRDGNRHVGGAILANRHSDFDKSGVGCFVTGDAFGSLLQTLQTYRLGKGNHRGQVPSSCLRVHLPPHEHAHLRLQ